ncbi:serine/threonine-protein kinase [Nannocystis sp. SCPEA4]|uniref:protein kinase domain-containing protein n=1 Tax=Nannocystis sp. SCPEA4 TaxID=2996787 RepID=UPI002270C12F|nr:protein kinase [Nannocystis sp. SCPEA4]
MHKDAPADAPDGDSFAAQFAAAVPTRPREPPAEHTRARLAAQLFGAELRVPPLGPYRVLREIGHGAMGVVHEGRGPGDQQVALKTLRRPDPAAIARLKREFRNVVDVGHANLAAVYELALDQARGEWYIVMEYVPGDSWLAHLRPAGERAPEATIRSALGQLASGVYALHRAGLLHRDLKPSNVLVTGEGRVKIVDFGLARLADGGDEGLAGTAGYLAPELLAGAPPSPASDWFAVGVMLYEALAGRRPRVPPGPTPIDGVPAELLALCRDLLAEDPEARPSGRDLLLRLGLDAPPAPSPVFVGRADELAACARALDPAPALLLLVGPSGAGKSALLARLVADLRDRRGALVLHGRCYAGESVPYKALDGVVEALAQHLGTCSNKHVLASMPEEAYDLVRVFPALTRVIAATGGGGDPVDAAPRETRRRAVVALRRLLAGLGGERPVVLAIDDLQWGDADSARLLGELLAPPDPPAIVVAASVRSDVRPGSPFFAELDAAPLACPIHEVALDPLAPAEAERLAASLLSEGPGRGDDPGARQRLAAAIARESQGSPLFIEAMAQRMSDQGAAGVAATSLDGALQAEVAALEPGERLTLERLAVAGRPLRRDLALRQAGGAATRVLDGAALAVLGARHLVRPCGEGDSVETYHDRVREVVLHRLAAPDRRAHHRALALALAAAPDPDPDELVLHFHGADELPQAGAWALRAAERAAAALAFARAASLYEKAMSWGSCPPEHVLKYTVARADALVHAGRCAEAAPVYLTAAALAPDRLQELELRGRAVEHYLVSGRVDAGLHVLGPLAHELGLPFPATSAGTAVRLVGELARLALARRLPTPPTRAPAAPELLLRIDLCWSAGKGLGFIDPIRAAAFSAQGLRLALASGDPRRIARAAAYLTIVDINAPDPRRASAAARELALARGLATRLADPHLTGLTTILSGVAALNNGHWRRALAGVETGADLLRARCVDVHWERAIAHAMAMHALFMLGDFAGLRARAEAWQHEAEDTGDRFAGVVAILYTAHAALVAGDPSRARAAVQKALSLWPYEGFSFQHWLALGVEVACDLYDGRGRDAWRRVERAWPALVRSQLMRMQIPRIDAHRLRASAALAAAAAGRRELVRVAQSDAAALARERIELAHAGEDLIRAQIAALRRRPAADLVQRAADRFTGGNMPALAAAVRLGHDHLVGRSDTAAELALTRHGVRDPTRWSATVAPVLHDRFS